MDEVAVELRHPSWHEEAVFQLLERHGAAYCVMSGAHLPCVLRATTQFVYVRMHGPSTEHLHAGPCIHADLSWWADRIREWEHSGREVFVYFNNDGEGNAVRNADMLRRFGSGAERRGTQRGRSGYRNRVTRALEAETASHLPPEARLRRDSGAFG